MTGQKLVKAWGPDGTQRIHRAIHRCKIDNSIARQAGITRQASSTKQANGKGVIKEVPNNGGSNK